MISNHIPLMQFMDGVHRYVIPIFQRDYSWTTKHCKRLRRYTSCSWINVASS